MPLITLSHIRCSASDRRRVPVGLAQHVHRRVPDGRRRTRESAATIGGGTPDRTIWDLLTRIKRERVPPAPLRANALQTLRFACARRLKMVIAAL
jgi:hypothetical protein